MNNLWTKRNVVIYVSALVIGSVVSTFIPGDMLTRVLMTFPVIIVVMVVGIVLLDKQARSKEAH